ncbi:transposase [Marinobacterium sp. xm-d-510]|uniref:IS66 family transposase n=1 Tax=Marinobacterium sp. xm-d-510 TaxID=2497735 RepID=UPI001C2C1A0A
MQTRAPNVFVAQIAQLYAVEKEARGKAPEERVALRQAKAKPVFDELELWLQAQLRKVSGKTKLAEAIRYAPNCMQKSRPHRTLTFEVSDC